MSLSPQYRCTGTLMAPMSYTGGFFCTRTHVHTSVRVLRT
jgi:hypothetical protein